MLWQDLRTHTHCPSWVTARTGNTCSTLSGLRPSHSRICTINSTATAFAALFPTPTTGQLLCILNVGGWTTWSSCDCAPVGLHLTVYICVCVCQRPPLRVCKLCVQPPVYLQCVQVALCMMFAALVVPTIATKLKNRPPTFLSGPQTDSASQVAGFYSACSSIGGSAQDPAANALVQLTAAATTWVSASSPADSASNADCSTNSCGADTLPSPHTCARVRAGRCFCGLLHTSADTDDNAGDPGHGRHGSAAVLAATAVVTSGQVGSAAPALCGLLWLCRCCC